MRRRILWITFWTTLVFWLGGAWGCASSGSEQNYRILDEQHDRDLFETEPATGVEQAQEVDLAQADDAAEDAEPQVGDIDPVADADVEAEPIGAGPTTDRTAGVVDLDHLIDLYPPTSVTGIDRAHWQRFVTTAEQGVAWHRTTYFHDWPLDHPDETDIDSPDIEQRYEAALVHERPGNWDRVNAVNAAAQPVKFGLDMVLFPFRAVQDRPWQIEKSPDYLVE